MNHNTHALAQTLLLDARIREALFGNYVVPLEFPFAKGSSDPAEAEAADKFEESRQLLHRARALLLEAQEALISRAAEPADVEKAIEESRRFLGRP